jgi:HSP20 family protein
MALVRWDPVTELAGIEIDRLNRMFAGLYNEGIERAWVPAVDIFETENHEVVIQAELPDFKREDLKVTFEQNVLTLHGSRTRDQEQKRDTFQRMERHYGSFTRSFTLPATVDASRISASYRDGVLTITLPQREDEKPRQIAVETE